MKRILKYLTLLSAASLCAAGPGAAADGGYTIGLSMYSLRDLFQSGTLHALDYPAFAKETFGIRHIDVWYGGLPRSEVNNPLFYARLKERAAAEGVDIFLLMTGTFDVTSSDAEVLQERAAAFYRDVDRAKLLGARYLRIFLNAGSGDRERAVLQSVKGLRYLSEYAGEKEIVLAIEPGGSALSKDGVFLAEVAKTLNHPSCKLMPDFGKMLGADPYGGTEAMMPYTAVVSAKTHDISDEGETRDFDYPRLMQIVNDAGFSGIVAIEFEGKNPGQIDGVRATQKILLDLKP